MRALHLGLALAVLVGCTISAEAAAKGKKGKKGIHGTVTAVSMKDKDSGTITVQVQQGKKKNQANQAAPVEKTFTITSATTFQTVQHIKGQKQAETSAATFKDVAKGSRVLIQANGDAAETVSLLKGGKKK